MINEITIVDVLEELLENQKNRRGARDITQNQTQGENPTGEMSPQEFYEEYLKITSKVLQADLDKMSSRSLEHFRAELMINELPEAIYTLYGKAFPNDQSRAEKESQRAAEMAHDTGPIDTIIMAASEDGNLEQALKNAQKHARFKELSNYPGLDILRKIGGEAAQFAEKFPSALMAKFLNEFFKSQGLDASEDGDSRTDSSSSERVLDALANDNKAVSAVASKIINQTKGDREEAKKKAAQMIGQSNEKANEENPNNRQQNDANANTATERLNKAIEDAQADEESAQLDREAIADRYTSPQKGSEVSLQDAFDFFLDNFLETRLLKDQVKAITDLETSIAAFETAFRAGAGDAQVAISESLLRENPEADKELKKQFAAVEKGADQAFNDLDAEERIKQVREKSIATLRELKKQIVDTLKNMATKLKSLDDPGANSAFRKFDKDLIRKEAEKLQSLLFLMKKELGIQLNPKVTANVAESLLREETRQEKIAKVKQAYRAVRPLMMGIDKAMVKYKDQKPTKVSTVSIMTALKRIKSEISGIKNYFVDRKTSFTGEKIEYKAMAGLLKRFSREVSELFDTLNDVIDDKAVTKEEQQGLMDKMKELSDDVQKYLGAASLLDRPVPPLPDAEVKDEDGEFENKEGDGESDATDDNDGKNTDDDEKDEDDLDPDEPTAEVTPKEQQQKLLDEFGSAGKDVKREINQNANLRADKRTDVAGAIVKLFLAIKVFEQVPEEEEVNESFERAPSKPPSKDKKQDPEVKRHLEKVDDDPLPYLFKKSEITYFFNAFPDASFIKRLQIYMQKNPIFKDVIPILKKHYAYRFERDSNHNLYYFGLGRGLKIASDLYKQTGIKDLKQADVEKLFPTNKLKNDESGKVVDESQERLVEYEMEKFVKLSRSARPLFAGGMLDPKYEDLEFKDVMKDMTRDSVDSNDPTAYLVKLFKRAPRGSTGGLLQQLLEPENSNDKFDGLKRLNKVVKMQDFFNVFYLAYEEEMGAVIVFLAGRKSGTSPLRRDLLLTLFSWESFVNAGENKSTKTSQLYDEAIRWHKKYMQLLKRAKIPAGDKSTGKVFISDPAMEEQLTEKLKHIVELYLQRKQNG